MQSILLVGNPMCCTPPLLHSLKLEGNGRAQPHGTPWSISLLTPAGSSRLQRDAWSLQLEYPLGALVLPARRRVP